MEFFEFLKETKKKKQTGVCFFQNRGLPQRPKSRGQEGKCNQRRSTKVVLDHGRNSPLELQPGA